MQHDKVRRAFLHLLEKNRWSRHEVRERLKQAADRRYWKRLNPQLSITDRLDLSGVKTKALGSKIYRHTLEKMDDSGYFEMYPVFSPSLLRRMRRTIDVLRGEDWPPILAIVYDEFWLLFRTPLLVHLLGGILGPGYSQIPHVWCHYVSPTPGASGWWPHVDGFQKSGRVSVWIPLTDATLHNGCIYLIPQNRIPERLAQTFTHRSRFSKEELRLLLQNSHALPARAGSILCWNFGVIHWGSAAGHTHEPRISIAAEFIGKDFPPERHETPVLDAQASIPTFDERLQIAGRGLRTYQKFEPRIIRYAELAARLT